MCCNVLLMILQSKKMKHLNSNFHPNFEEHFPFNLTTFSFSFSFILIQVNEIVYKTNTYQGDLPMYIRVRVPMNLVVFIHCSVIA